MEDRIVWMDLEMTGLDPDIDTIIEIATIVTTSELDVLATAPTIAIDVSEDRLQTMDEWNRTTHSKSGLWKRVLESNVSLAEAETATLEFLSDHTIKGKSPLAGNSIWQDRRFIAKHMKKLDDWLHYRLIDVSTLKELRKRWFPDTPEFLKESSHLALEDIRDSLEELAHYRRFLFPKPPTR